MRHFVFSDGTKTSCKKNNKVTVFWLLQEVFSLSVNQCQKWCCLEWPWHVSHTEKQSKWPFYEAVVISVLLRAIWEMLRHSGGNTQRCFSLPVSIKIAEILTVVFLKYLRDATSLCTSVVLSSFFNVIYLKVKYYSFLLHILMLFFSFSPSTGHHIM